MNPHPAGATRAVGEHRSLAGRVLVAASRYSVAVGISLVALVTALAWLVSWWAGGSHTVAPHLFYVPVIFAAVRFGPWGALAAAVVAGVAAGPVLPLDVDAGTSQEALNWVLRSAAFILVGQITAFLVHHSWSEIGAELRHAVMRRELYEALDDRQLHVVYQPIVDLASREVVGAEALIRWPQPDGSFRPPDRFIPEVEDAGVAHLVTDLVLDEVSQQLASWRSSGLIAHDSDFRVAVNVSGSELQGDVLHVLEKKVRDVVVGARIPASWLQLEITETALIEDLDAAIHGLQRLRGVGVRIAIDDFGTGESTLRYLHKLPVHTVKIDRSFIAPLIDDDRGRAIVGCVAALAATMGLTSVAEGVETAEHAQLLADLGCTLAQGYYFAPPLGVPDFEQILTERSLTSSEPPAAEK